jgi:hypothetical protein
MKYSFKLIIIVLTAFIAGIALGVSADVTITTTPPSNCFVSLTSPEVGKLLSAASEQREACVCFTTNLDVKSLPSENVEELRRLTDSTFKVDAVVRETILKDFPCAQLSDAHDE